MKDYSKEELVAGLLRIERKFPACFRHFFLCEIDPELYNQILVDREKEYDSRKDSPGLDQK